MILETVEQTIQKFQMLKSGDRIIVAVSGGADSVALLYLLNKLSKKYRLYLHIAHLNHLLRKEESDQDSVFVQGLATRLKLPLTCKNVNVDDFAKKAKLSLEDAARRIRYDFLLSVAKENRAHKIALGHNRDDQAETVLMRFLRGSGIAGLRGIPAKRSLNDCLVIRPLIELSRAKILYFLSAKDIRFRTDSSNLKDLYFRNRIRNKLLPALEKNFNPNLREVLINLAQNMSEDFDFLEQAGKNKFKAVRASSNQATVAINLKKFAALHKALQKLVTRLAIRELKGHVYKIDYRHWKELEDLAAKRPKNSIVDLPGAVSATKSGKSLIFYKRNGKKGC
ncbi:MAG: tRNA lysidine(34) synthetase TilS [Omnitrophica bacterium]|nr:tRNA lysidine(34) synthetase TilS [Candidatus Omnitrophota bacterium]